MPVETEHLARAPAALRLGARKYIDDGAVAYREGVRFEDPAFGVDGNDPARFNEKIGFHYGR